MSNMKFFSAPWDGLVKGVTIGVLIFIVSLILIFSFISKIPILVRIVFAILFGYILLVPFLWAPRGYAIRDRLVIVKRLIGDVKIIIAAEPERWQLTWWGVRLWASGGLYGYFGAFAFKGTGIVHMYATNRHKLVLIKDLKGKKYIISPGEPDKLFQLL